MKLKIKYTLISLADKSEKTYTKTFSKINEAAENESIANFSEAYLRLIDKEGSDLSYELYKSNDELIKQSTL